jgi:hypothetical protein
VYFCHICKYTGWGFSTVYQFCPNTKVTYSFSFKNILLCHDQISFNRKSFTPEMILVFNSLPRARLQIGTFFFFSMFISFYNFLQHYPWNSADIFSLSLRKKRDEIAVQSCLASYCYLYPSRQCSYHWRSIYCRLAGKEKYCNTDKFNETVAPVWVCLKVAWW